ncbi:MAG TPA: YsnF/AvaK domain-containing protein [Allosphingosinicella sp.]|nr:YsnF/AvaK domain-containing protein [Allosphingosinicella sp.]
MAAIPLVEERLAVGKREVETGRFRVRIEVDQREETVTEELARDEIDIERVPMNVPLSEVPNVRLEGSTTIIPVVEEVLVVEKKLMLVEEIHLRRRTTSEVQEIPVTVRSERAVVDREDVTEDNTIFTDDNTIPRQE